MAVREVMKREESRGCIPANFTCPISLEVMVEPVTLCTGHSFDRSNIERWFAEGEIMCPMTLQILLDPCFVPNKTLRTMILNWFKHDWLELRAAGGVDSDYDIPTPIQITLLCRELRGREKGQTIPPQAIRRLRSIAKGGERDRHTIAKKGAVPRLIDILLEEDDSDKNTEMFVYAVGALAVLPLDQSQRRQIALSSAFPRLCELLKDGNFGGGYAGELLAQLAEVEDLRGLIGQSPGMLQRLLDILDNGGPAKQSAAAIRTLLQLCHSPKLRAEAVELGAVGIVVENLLPSKRDAENSVAILELLCYTADGRTCMIEHPLAIPTLVRVMNSTSEWGAAHATSALHCLCKANPELGGVAAIQSGALPQLLLVVQSNASLITKQRAIDLLKLLRNMWKDYNFPAQYSASSIIGHLEQRVE
ncbi:unnamed protein product [Calypogeia fissa]